MSIKGRLTVASLLAGVVIAFLVGHFVPTLFDSHDIGLIVTIVLEVIVFALTVNAVVAARIIIQ